MSGIDFQPCFNPPHRGSRLDRDVLLGPSCSVGTDALLSGCVLGRGCHVGAGASVRNSVLMDGVRVGANCHVLGSVLGPGAELGDGCSVPARCLLGPGVRLLRERTKLEEGTRC